MMAHKHLHELLKEDQEPFLLKKYIADRQSQLKRRITKTSLRPNKRKPILVDTSSSKRSLCKQACFFSFTDSPDVRKSPFLDFPPSPGSPNAVILHIPSRTATLLLEAAMRIQKQSSSAKPKTQIKNAGFGLFGSILKRLSSKNRTRNYETGGTERDSILARKSAGKSEKKQENELGVDQKSAFSCSCNNSRRNSTVWSESNEEKSLDLESSSSSRSDQDSEEIEFVVEERENGGFGFCEKQFCSSPLSPFRFALQNSPSPGRRTPVFSSPATSPSRHRKQEEEEEEEEEEKEKEKEKEKGEVESIQKIESADEEEEEEKEQFSPVSVLDPPFEDDFDGNHDDEEDNHDEEDGYDLECSYAIVQKAKQQLLLKLRRFEKLAELDPIELEKRMLQDQDDEDENKDLEQEEECEEDESPSSYREKNVDLFVREVLSKSGLHVSKVSADMKRLVLDLIAEERREDDGSDSNDNEVVAKRVCKRLDSWKEVKSNTIDMMVELDFRREVEGWKRNDKEQVGETAMEIELAIFGILMEELSEELVCLASGESSQSFCSSK